jgi:hypothetical protein
MHVDANPHAGGFPPVASALAIKTPQGETLIVDPAAKLEQGATVAVFLDGCFMLVGRILRKPVTHRRLVIGYRDVHGNEGVTRIYGLLDDHTVVWRVTGVVRDL